MRHRKGFNHLGRTSAHRKAMLSNMASSLILHKRITTTTAKAKALRTYIEPLITRSKNDTTHSRRVVFSHLQNKFAVAELFREVSPKVMDRPGGYTRILKTGNRLGDNAEMCVIELVDYNENMLGETTTKSKSTRRRRRGSGKAKTEAAAGSTAAGQGEMKEEISPDAEAATALEEMKAEAGKPQEEKVALSDQAEATGSDAESAEKEAVAEEAESAEKEEAVSAEKEKAAAEKDNEPEAKAKDEGVDDTGDKQDDSSEDSEEEADSGKNKKE